MKKMISVAFVAALLATGVGVKANADSQLTNNAPESTAKFHIVNGDLTLAKTPSFDFGTTTVYTLVKDAGTVKMANLANNSIVVNNYDTQVSNWTVSAQASDFINENKDILPNAQIKLNIDKNIGEVSISGQSNAVNVLSQSAQLGSTSVDVAKNATLDLTGLDKDKVKNVKSGYYKSNVTWTLSNTTPTKPASSFK